MLKIAIESKHLLRASLGMPAFFAPVAFFFLPCIFLIFLIPLFHVPISYNLSWYQPTALYNLGSRGNRQPPLWVQLTVAMVMLGHLPGQANMAPSLSWPFPKSLSLLLFWGWGWEAVGCTEGQGKVAPTKISEESKHVLIGIEIAGLGKQPPISFFF